MKKTVLTFLIIIIFSGFIYTQNTPQKGFKIYTNAFAESYSISSEIDEVTTFYENNYVSVGMASFGYASRKNRWWKEMEIGYSLKNNNDLTIRSFDTGGVPQFIDGDRNTASLLSMRFEVYRDFASSDKFSFLLGLSGQTFWLNHRFYPMTSVNFPNTYHRISLNVAAVPRLQWHFEQFSIDFNLPLRLTNTSFALQRVENPIIPDAERTSSNFSHDMLNTKNMVQARLGVFWYL